MALPPGNPDTFMREVDDAVRADRAREVAQRYGRAIIIAAVVGLLALGGWLFWQSRSHESSGALGTQFSAAIDSLAQNRPRSASAAVEPLVKGDDPTYRALALMTQANAAAAQGDLAGAATRFGRVAADEDVDQALRDTALLRQMLAQFDTIEPGTLIARLRHLVATPGPAFGTAAELTALAEMKRGNDAVAADLFRRIAASEDAPEGLKTRAAEMASMLSASPARPAAARGAASASITRPPAAAGTTRPAAAAPATRPQPAQPSGE